MIQNHRPLRFLHLAVAAATLLALSACVTAPKEGALVVGQQATIEGDVVSVDTNPWAYDGNAVVTISTASTGMIKVQLPARWNLCKAPPPDNVQALKPRDRVQVVGIVSAPRELVVCAEPAHRLRKIE
jgi:hypothetical protein